MAKTRFAVTSVRCRRGWFEKGIGRLLAGAKLFQTVPLTGKCRPSRRYANHKRRTPQPVVSRRYAFLCSRREPFGVKPDWSAGCVMKLTPIIVCRGLGHWRRCGQGIYRGRACIRSGSAKARTSLNGSTSARGIGGRICGSRGSQSKPIPSEECRARIRAFFYSKGRRACSWRQRGQIE